MNSEVASLRSQVSQLEIENAAIRDERDVYRERLSTIRNDFSGLTARVEYLECELRDSKRKLARSEARAEVPGPGPHYDVIEIGSSDADIEGIDPPGIKTQARKDPALVSSGSNVVSLSDSGQIRQTKAPTSSSSKTMDRRVAQDLSTTSKRYIDQVEGAQPPNEAKRVKDVIEATDARDVMRKGNDKGLVQSSVPISIQAATQSEEALATSEPPIRSNMSDSITPTQAHTTRASNKRPDFKIKHKACILSEEAVSKYLSNSMRLDINPAPPHLLVSRQFLNKVYGGSQYTLLAKSRNGSRQFIFPTPDINPEMPTSPGNPGLLLSCRLEMVGITCTLFSRMQTAPAKWEYIGEYDSVLAGQLSASEFTQQRKEVKDAWADHILSSRQWSVYVSIRARVWLRKEKKELSKDNIEKESARIRAGRAGPLSDADVIESLERGDEHINIIRMDCKKYDHEFFQGMLTQSEKATTTTKKLPARSTRRKTIRPDDGKDSGTSDVISDVYS